MKDSVQGKKDEERRGGGGGKEEGARTRLKVGRTEDWGQRAGGRETGRRRRGGERCEGGGGEHWDSGGEGAALENNGDGGVKKSGVGVPEDRGSHRLNCNILRGDGGQRGGRESDGGVIVSPVVG
eukprot:750904-Hanusia_phi.AAC.3